MLEKEKKKAAAFMTQQFVHRAETPEQKSLIIQPNSDMK